MMLAGDKVQDKVQGKITVYSIKLKITTEIPARYFIHHGLRYFGDSIETAL